MHTTIGMKGNTEMKKRIGLWVAGISTAVAVIYIGFAIFFQSHFSFGTSIDGVSVGGCSVEAAKARLRAEIAGYSLKLVGREDQAASILGNSIGVAPVFNGEVEALLGEQNGFAWGATLFQGAKLEVEQVVSYDEAALDAEIQKLSFLREENQRRPVSAGFSEYDKETGYTLIAADYGTTVDKDAFKRAVSEAVEGLQDELDLSESGCYVEPEVGDDDAGLLALLDDLNRYVGTVITYEFGEKREVLDAERISTWLGEENGLISVDQEAVRSFVKELAKSYNTAYKPKVLMTSYGKEVTISGGAYGWRIDNEGEMAQILVDLDAGEAVTREPVYLQTANSHGENDYGNSYVEINLTAQHLFVYEDGNLVVESDFVSGDLAKGYASPTGAFPVTYTTTDAVLRGENYVTPVKYWMPFAGNVGMHDATWRRSFGGSIYKRNGSHGCINLPKSAAQTIYNTIKKGDPVLVYTLPGTESAAVQQQDAQNIMNLINSIGPVTLESEPVITSARNLYNALPESARGYVTNYDTLTAAEAALAQLKAAQASVEQAPVEPLPAEQPVQ